MGFLAGVFERRRINPVYLDVCSMEIFWIFSVIESGACAGDCDKFHHEIHGIAADFADGKDKLRLSK